jgi:L-seryl-tRNA(Ser) seleniumtransferase
MSVYERYGLTKVINARGPSTVLGAAKCSPTVRRAVADALTANVEIVELQARVSRAVARFSGAEAGCAVGCTAAGIAVSVAACMTGDNLARIKELPNVDGLRHKFVIQKGHIIMAGETPIYQLVRMTGGKLVEIGEAADCGVYQLEEELDGETAAALYVMGGRANGPGMIPPRRFIETCRAKGVPVIVDDASGLNVRQLIEAGADLVIFSGQKWLGGPTVGLIAGRKDLVYACFLQDNGIGRPMKVGKEGMIGAIQAMKDWETRDWRARAEKQVQVANYMAQRLQGIPGVEVKVEQTSSTGAAAWVLLTVDPSVTKISTWEVSELLAKHKPVIKTHDYDFAFNYFSLDPAFMDDGDEVILCDALINIFGQAAERQDTFQAEEPPTRLDLVADLMRSWYQREEDFKAEESD